MFHLPNSLDNVAIDPWCSVYVINPDRIWVEPWRFVTYGFVHNNIEHITTNVFCQLFFGLPLELSHSSCRVAIVYFSGIMFGGFGRQIFTKSNLALAGASGNYQLNPVHNQKVVYKLNTLYNDLV